jgi:hypothetical protein
MANDISSAINNFTFAIGDCCGPIIGGFLSTHFGFKHCCLFVSLIILSYSILFFTYFRNYIYSDIKKIGMEELVDDTNNKTDEKELINHPGLYKGDNINNNNIEIEEKGEELKKHLDEAEYLKFDDDQK